MRSPYHLRTVEVRNATDSLQTLKIEPTSGQHLGASTTFTGVLEPGEVKVLYLYHGLEYDASIFPVHHDRYGLPEAPREFVIIGGSEPL